MNDNLLAYVIFFFKQKTAYEMRISDWSSDVCSSDLSGPRKPQCPERDENDQRVIEALPVQIVHIVEHPEEVPRPPRIAAHDKKARGIERDIGAAVLRIGEVDAPHRALMIARFKVRLRAHAAFADRRLVHQRTDVAGHLLIDKIGRAHV